MRMPPSRVPIYHGLLTLSLACQGSGECHQFCNHHGIREWEQNWIKHTCLQQTRVGVDGCDGPHALGHDGIADGVSCVGFPQRVAQDRIHVVRRGLVTGA